MHINRKVYNLIRQYNCIMCTGDKGAGKSTLLACVARAGQKLGYKVYCQYPYKNTFKIPLTLTVSKNSRRYDVDKQWLYNTDLSHSIVMLDEVKTIWHARAFTSWTMEDEEFFNFLRKNDTILIMCTQAYDSVDINCRRASDILCYLTKGSFIKQFTHIDVSQTTLCKVADKQTEVVGRMFNKGMRKVVWDVCEVPLQHILFFRPPYYNDFYTNFTFNKKQPDENPISWDDEFEMLEAKET